MELPVVTNLKQPKYLLLFLGFAMVIFDIGYYLMATLPGSKNFSCALGVNITAENIIFNILVSLMIALILVGVVVLFSRGIKKHRAHLAGLSGSAMVLAMLSLFCPICAFPIFGIFGLSLGLNFFSNYNFVLKIASVVLMGLALYLLNKRLRDECDCG